MELVDKSDMLQQRNCNDCKLRSFNFKTPITIRLVEWIPSRVSPARFNRPAEKFSRRKFPNWVFAAFRDRGYENLSAFQRFQRIRVWKQVWGSGLNFTKVLI